MPQWSAAALALTLHAQGTFFEGGREKNPRRAIPGRKIPQGKSDAGQKVEGNALTVDGSGLMVESPQQSAAALALTSHTQGAFFVGGRVGTKSPAGQLLR